MSVKDWDWGDPPPKKDRKMPDEDWGWSDPPPKKDRKMPEDPAFNNSPAKSTKDSILVSTDMSAAEIRDRFNARKNNDLKELQSVQSCITQLEQLIGRMQEAGIDISLYPLSYDEKSRLIPEIAKDSSSTANTRRVEFMFNVQLGLKIYDRTYLIMTVDNNRFYMMDGVINKKFKTPPDPNREDKENGSIYSFADDESINLFLESTMATATFCAAQAEVCKNMQRPDTGSARPALNATQKPNRIPKLTPAGGKKP